MGNIIDKVFDGTTNGIHRALDLTMRRNEALTSNIANAETPKYRASDLSFAGELDEAFSRQAGEMVKTDTRHMDVSGDSGTAHLVADYTGTTKADGNNVDIDIQMGKLARNSSRYGLATSFMRHKFYMIGEVIRNGGR